MKKIKLFLASSTELKTDREQFEIFINRKNNEWIEKGIFIQLLIWEDFLDAMSQTRLQEEYNKAIRECDIFVMLFFTKVGKYTKEELETAFGQFKETNKPYIFTYFKDAEVSTGNINRKDMMSLFAFQEKLDALGHFYTRYRNIDDLKFQFDKQLDKLTDILIVESEEKKPKLSGELNQLRNLLEQGETTNGLLKLRSIIKTKLDKIAKDHGHGETKEPPMHILRLLAKNHIIAAKAQNSLEYALSVTSKSLHEIEVDQKEATDALTKADEGLRIIDSENRQPAAKAISGKFVLKRARDGQFYFNLKAANGKIILTSEMYTAKASLVNGIASVKENAKHDYRFDRRTSKSGHHYFLLKAANNETIGTSKMYSSTNSMENGIISVKQNAPIAQIVDQAIAE